MLGCDFNAWGMETSRGSIPPLRRFVCADANHEVGPRGRPCARDKKRGGAACLRAASANPLTGSRLVSRLGRCILNQFRHHFRFILVSVYMVMAFVCALFRIPPPRSPSHNFRCRFVPSGFVPCHACVWIGSDRWALCQSFGPSVRIARGSCHAFQIVLRVTRVVPSVSWHVLAGWLSSWWLASWLAGWLVGWLGLAGAGWG